MDTIKAFDKFGLKERALPISPEIIKEHFNKIQKIGIDFEAVLDNQVSEGLQQFKEAFKEILESL